MTLLVTAVGIIAILTAIFLISENRRPQATLAWLLVLVFLPGFGLLIYILFGRDSKAFSNQTKLLMQDLEVNAAPLLDPLISQQDDAIASLETRSTSHRKLMHLVRHNYGSVLTLRNQVTILQDSDQFYPAMVADMIAALSGVDVRVMMSEYEPGNPLPSWAGNTYAESISRSGVKVFHYHRGYLHAKTIAIDSHICSVGSANIDIRSFSINYELNAVLYDENLTRQLEQDFKRDLHHCTLFDPDEYHRRNRLIRFRDSVARLLSPLLIS